MTGGDRGGACGSCNGSGAMDQVIEGGLVVTVGCANCRGRGWLPAAAPVPDRASVGGEGGPDATIAPTEPDWSFTCPSCGWRTTDVRYEQHPCPAAPTVQDAPHLSGTTVPAAPTEGAGERMDQWFAMSQAERDAWTAGYGRGQESVSKAWEHWVNEARAERDAALAERDALRDTVRAREAAARELIAMVEPYMKPGAADEWRAALVPSSPGDARRETADSLDEGEPE